MFRVYCYVGIMERKMETIIMGYIGIIVCIYIYNSRLYGFRCVCRASSRVYIRCRALL